MKSYFKSVDVKSSSGDPSGMPRRTEEFRARDILARNMKRVRLKRHLTQEALADVAGLDRTYIGSIERSERNVSIDNIEKIATALGVTISELLKEQAG
jgi:DNA-binding XRE family transcriptional regulator